MLRSQNAVRPSTWLLLALIILLGAALRIIELEYAPIGGHGDVAWKGINALDWVDRGVFPYYVWELYAPEPVNVLLPGLLMPLTGVSYLAGRTGTVIAGVLLIAFAFPAAWWLLYEASPRHRELAGLLAALAVATSMHANYLSRLGMRAAIFPMQVMLLTWLSAWAWHKGGWWRWILAGIALAFMQYTYIPGRLFPLVLFLWALHGYWATRKGRWRGWLLVIVVGVVLSLPNIIAFITTPEAFTARADTGTATTGGWIWLYDMSARGGLIAVLLQKIGLELLAFGIVWDAPYTILNKPMLEPLFFIGFLIAGAMALFYPRRIALAWPLMGIPVMFFTDLISGAIVQNNPLRQTGVLAFVYLLAGVGLAAGCEWLLAALQSPRTKRIAQVVLLVAALTPTLFSEAKYLREFIPNQYADPDSGWLTEQIDVDLSRRIIEQPDKSYLVPYDEYNRANIAFLTADVYRFRHSALDETGTLHIPNPPDKITIVTTSDPYRIRHDGRESVWDPRLWVLLHQGEALYLPPLLPGQVAAVETLLDTQEPERLIDRSGTEIAQLYAVDAPAGLFQSRPALVHPVQDAAFALPGGEPEVRLVGYDLPSVNLEPGAITYVTLYWQPLRQRLSEDYEIFVQIWDDTGNAIASTHDFTNGGTYRSRIWLPDETTISYHWFRLPEDMPPGAYTLATGLYRVLQNEPLSVSGSSTAGSEARLRDLRVLPQVMPEPATPLDAALTFGDLLHVATFDAVLDDTPLTFGGDWLITPGASITVRFGWEVLNTEAADRRWAAPPLPEVDYSLFLHLTADDDAPPIAQADQALGAAIGLPSGVWYGGDAWPDTLMLHLPDDLEPGTYTLWAGVYYYLDGTRLTPTLDGAAQPNGRVRLAVIEVSS